eukprot:6200047-Pleurochrysis_carterae.AAC.1
MFFEKSSRIPSKVTLILSNRAGSCSKRVRMCVSFIASWCAASFSHASPIAIVVLSVSEVRFRRTAERRRSCAVGSPRYRHCGRGASSRDENSVELHFMDAGGDDQIDSSRVTSERTPRIYAIPRKALPAEPPVIHCAHNLSMY